MITSALTADSKSSDDAYDCLGWLQNVTCQHNWSDHVSRLPSLYKADLLSMCHHRPCAILVMVKLQSCTRKCIQSQPVQFYRASMFRPIFVVSQILPLVQLPRHWTVIRVESIYVKKIVRHVVVSVHLQTHLLYFLRKLSTVDTMWII